MSIFEQLNNTKGWTSKWGVYVCVGILLHNIKWSKWIFEVHTVRFVHCVELSTAFQGVCSFKLNFKILTSNMIIFWAAIIYSLNKCVLSKVQPLYICYSIGTFV